MTKWNLIHSIESLIDGEIVFATANFSSFNNAHEGYAVLLEEVDELWDAIKLNQKRHPYRIAKIKEEAIHVAAMAIRLIHDCCHEKRIPLHLDPSFHKLLARYVRLLFHLFKDLFECCFCYNL